MKRVLILGMAVMLFASMLTIPVSAIGFDRENRLSIVSEPEGLPADGIRYYRGDEQITADDLQWVDNGYDGKALYLPGDGTFLRLDYTVARLSQFTFSAWINRQGDESGERLFSVARSDQNYLTFSPYMYDPTLFRENGILNGMYLRYQYGGANGTDLDLFTPTNEQVSYAIPKNEWHHVAVTADGRTAQVYIDGVLWLEDRMMNTVYELLAFSLDIGTGEWGDPTLHALLDNVEVYRKVLNAEEIQALADVEDTTPYLPTRPTTTTTTTVTTVPVTTTQAKPIRQTVSDTLWGIPLWGVYTLGGIIAAYVVLTVVLNWHDRKKKGGGS